MQVPTGVDSEIPGLGPSPYPARGIAQPVALFAGNLYARTRQPEVNLIWQEKLNQLGSLLKSRGVHLVAAGLGDTDRIDPEAVTHVGPIELSRFWDWQRHAQVGLVIAQGAVQDNESSKIYYYLRTGLPVVCERPVPNSWLIETTGLGALVNFGDLEAMAEAAARSGTRAAQKPRCGAVRRRASLLGYSCGDLRPGLCRDLCDAGPGRVSIADETHRPSAGAYSTRDYARDFRRSPIRLQSNWLPHLTLQKAPAMLTSDGPHARVRPRRPRARPLHHQ